MSLVDQSEKKRFRRPCKVPQKEQINIRLTSLIDVILLLAIKLPCIIENKHIEL